MKKILFPLATIILAACNNSENSTTTTTDSSEKKMSHDTSHMMSTGVPDLPAVPEGAKVSFVNLKGDQEVTSPVKVDMAVEGMKIDTAGPVVAASGHFHILIDAEDVYPEGQMIPKDSTHLHYGKGQTTDNVKLSPGKHKLTIQFADGAHRSYGSKMAATIKVKVKE
jgi:hypothetical protein